jgi:hypothetical protein
MHSHKLQSFRGTTQPQFHIYASHGYLQLLSNSKGRCYITDISIGTPRLHNYELIVKTVVTAKLNVFYSPDDI